MVFLLSTAVFGSQKRLLSFSQTAPLAHILGLASTFRADGPVLPGLKVVTCSFSLY